MASNPQRIQELQRELAGNPSSRQFYQLGELLRRDGRAAEAVTVLRGGLGFHPRYVAAWVALGRCYLEIGQAGSAAGALDSAITLDQANPVAWRLLGEARLMLGSRLGALEAMSRALELAPGDDVLQAAVESLSSQTAPPEELPALVVPPEQLELSAATPALDVAAAPIEQPPVAPSAMAWPYFEPMPAPPRWQTVASPPPRDVEELPDPFATTGVFSAAELEGLDVFEIEPAPALLVGEGPFGAPEAGQAPVAAPFPQVEPEAGPEAEPQAPLEPPAASLIEAEPIPEGVPPAAFAAPAEPEVEQLPAVESVAPVAEPLPERPAVAAPVFEAGEREPRAEESVEAVETAPVLEAPAAAIEQPAVVSVPPASITLARLHIQQQQFDDAVAMLERLLRADPENQEARDLLELVRDMMEPILEPLPPLAPRERKIAALQRWLASITLARERIGR